MAPAQLAIFIDKQAGECMTPSSSEEKILEPERGYALAV